MSFSGLNKIKPRENIIEMDVFREEQDDNKDKTIQLKEGKEGREENKELESNKIEEEESTTNFKYKSLVGSDIEKVISESKNNSYSSNLFSELLGETNGFKIIKIKRDSEVEIDPVNVKDSTGRISKFLNSLSSTIDSRIVPRKITKIPSWVEPNEHIQFEVGGEDYYAPKEGSSKIVSDFISKALEDLNVGKVVKENICTLISYGGDSKIECPKYTPAEIKEILTKLNSYSSKLVETSDGRLILVIGDYIYE